MVPVSASSCKFRYENLKFKTPAQYETILQTVNAERAAESDPLTAHGESGPGSSNPPPIEDSTHQNVTQVEDFAQVDGTQVSTEEFDLEKNMETLFSPLDTSAVDELLEGVEDCDFETFLRSRKRGGRQQ